MYRYLLILKVLMLLRSGVICSIKLNGFFFFRQHKVTLVSTFLFTLIHKNSVNMQIRKPPRAHNRFPRLLGLHSPHLHTGIWLARMFYDAITIACIHNAAKRLQEHLNQSLVLNTVLITISCHNILLILNLQPISLFWSQYAGYSCYNNNNNSKCCTNKYFFFFIKKGSS